MQLSFEDQQKSVHVSVMQEIQNPWNWKMDEMVELGAHTSNASVIPSPSEVEEMKFPIPADGLIYLLIPLKNNTVSLTIDVSLLFKNYISLLMATNCRRVYGWTSCIF